MIMTYVKLESTNLKEVAWSDETLFVRFHNGREYSYSGVPYEVFSGLLLAPSAGKYFNAEVKQKYTFTEEVMSPV